MSACLYSYSTLYIVDFNVLARDLSSVDSRHSADQLLEISIPLRVNELPGSCFKEIVHRASTKEGRDTFISSIRIRTVEHHWDELSAVRTSDDVFRVFVIDDIAVHPNVLSPQVFRDALKPFPRE